MTISQLAWFVGHSVNFTQWWAVGLLVRNETFLHSWELNIRSWILDHSCAVLFSSSIYSCVLTRRHRGKVLCQWIIRCWRERWMTGREKSSVDFVSKFAAEKLSTVCFGNEINFCINFCLFCSKTVSTVQIYCYSTLCSLAPSRYNS